MGKRVDKQAMRWLTRFWRLRHSVGISIWAWTGCGTIATDPDQHETCSINEKWDMRQR